jgi:hypothetical protein
MAIVLIATYSRVLYLFGSPFREGVFMLKIKSQCEVFSCEKIPISEKHLT